jgi:hypothetical protein
MQLVLPILLDMVEEMSSNLDAQKMQNIEEFVQSFFVQPQQQQQQPSAPAAASCSTHQACQQKPSMRCGRGRPQFFCAKRQQCPRPQQNNGDFSATFDVKSFKPEEINVKVKGREITIEGKQEEREEDFGFISRNFTRRIVLAEEFDIDSIATVMSIDGKMTIRASKLQPATPETTERIIPIQRVATEEDKAEDDNQEKAAEQTEESFELLKNVEA